MPHRLDDPVHAERVRELLNRLEELEPILRRSPRERWLSRFRNVMAVVSLGSFILAGAAIAKVRQSDSRNAQAGKAQSECLNRVLAERATVADRETAARREYALSQRAFADGNKTSVELILQRKPLAGLKLLNAIDVSFSAATAKFISELDAIQAFRDAHPLGAC